MTKRYVVEWLVASVAAAALIVAWSVRLDSDVVPGTTMWVLLGVPTLLVLRWVVFLVVSYRHSRREAATD